MAINHKINSATDGDFSGTVIPYNFGISPFCVLNTPISRDPSCREKLAKQNDHLFLSFNQFQAFVEKLLLSSAEVNLICSITYNKCCHKK